MAGREAPDLIIREDDLSGEPTRSLLALHLSGMLANSPPASVYALGLAGLKAPEVMVWSAWRGTEIAGVAALRRLPADVGEVKSMRTHPAHLRTGVAATLLTRVIAQARTQGLSKLNLETGSGDAFKPALALYRRFGFRSGEAFGDYTPNAFNQFLQLDL